MTPASFIEIARAISLQAPGRVIHVSLVTLWLGHSSNHAIHILNTVNAPILMRDEREAHQPAYAALVRDGILLAWDCDMTQGETQ